MLALIWISCAPSVHAQDGRSIAFEGDAQNRGGRLFEAREALTRALALDLYSARAPNDRGLIFLQLGDLEAALRDLSRAFDVAPDNGAIWNNRANVNCTLKRAANSVADRVQTLYRGCFTAAEAQGGLRRTGLNNGPSDGIWGYDSGEALLAWTMAECPRPPKTRLL